jgi:two-component system, chemotaxis family, chemotaxis protein CheY
MTSPSVLIVDDDSFVRTVLRDALQSVDARLFEAKDGDEAMSIVKEQKPSLILLDLFMPRRSGLELLAEIREVAPNTQIFVVSMMDSKQLIERALIQGAAGYITKPFHPVEIAATVSKALGN